LSTDNLEELREDSFVEKAIFAAKNAPEEKTEFRPQSSDMITESKKIDMYDDTVIGAEKLIANALECEQIALQIEGITNSEGSEASYARSKITFMRNDFFCKSYEKTLHQISIVTLAEKDGFLEQSYDFSAKMYYSDLKSPRQIAEKSAERTLKKLGARKIPSCKVPVVFDRRVSRQLLGSLVEAINGASVAKGISFLKDKLSQKIFSDGINITDRYDVARGLRSRPFDSEGLECRNNEIISNGVLSTFLLNTKYANRLKMKSTANASGFEGISPNNICIENGKNSVSDLLRSIKCGLYVTEVLGNGLNLVTGNYSQGAVGFWIENGEITYPVNEITIAGSFTEMFSHCTPASNMEHEFGMDAPTLFMDEMIVGGI